MLEVQKMNVLEFNCVESIVPNAIDEEDDILAEGDDGGDRQQTPPQQADIISNHTVALSSLSQFEQMPFRRTIQSNRGLLANKLPTQPIIGNHLANISSLVMSMNRLIVQLSYYQTSTSPNRSIEPDSIKSLLQTLTTEKKVIINTLDKPKSKSALMYAIEGKCVVNIQWLINQGAAVSGITDKHKKTTLMYACDFLGQTESHLSVIKLLLERCQEADVNAIDNGGITALAYACQHNHVPVIKLLIERGAHDCEHSTEPTITLPDSSYSCRKTALMCACEKGHLEVVSLLLHQTNPISDVHVRGKHDKTALIYACENGSYEIISLLFEHDAGKSVKVDDRLLIARALWKRATSSVSFEDDGTTTSIVKVIQLVIHQIDDMITAFTALLHSNSLQVKLQITLSFLKASCVMNDPTRLQRCKEIFHDIAKEDKHPPSCFDDIPIGLDNVLIQLVLVEKESCAEEVHTKLTTKYFQLSNPVNIIFAYAIWCFNCHDMIYDNKFSMRIKEIPEFSLIEADCQLAIRDICGYRGMLTVELRQSDYRWSDKLIEYYRELLDDIKILPTNASLEKSIGDDTFDLNENIEDLPQSDHDESEEIDEPNYHYELSDLEYLDEIGNDQDDITEV